MSGPDQKLSRVKISAKPHHSDDAVQAIRYLTQKTPINTYGLPDGYYRPDMLVRSSGTNSDIINSPVTDTKTQTNGNGRDLISIQEDAFKDPLALLGFDPSQIDVAWQPLDYSEGFPTIYDGRPFWTRLDYEPEVAYTAFESYLRQPKEQGARQLYLLADGLQARKDLLAHQKPDQGNLQQWFHVYYWASRAKAYDLFSEALRQRQRDERAISTMDYHYFQAEQLLEKCLEYMNGEEFMETLTPKAAIDFLKTVTQLQRISAGLPATGPSPEQLNDGNPLSVEVALRNIARKHHEGDPSATTIEEGDDGVLTHVLDDPETTEIVQELVLRLNSKQA